MHATLLVIWSLLFFCCVQRCSSYSDENSTAGITFGTDESSNAVTPFTDDVQEVYPPHKYPFFVRVAGFGISCGGSLITSRYVLSAAKCLPKDAKKDSKGNVDYATVQNFVVYVGVHNKSDEQNAHPVSSMIQFLGYSNNPNADILLIQLFTPVNFSKKVMLINLPDDFHLEEPGTEVTTTGWNFTAAGNYCESDTLKETKLMVLPPTVCDIFYEVSQYTFCSGNPTVAACLGDVGGPVFVERNDKYYLIGIVSKPGICGSEPGRYTKVSIFNTWIVRNIENLKLKNVQQNNHLQD